MSYGERDLSHPVWDVYDQYRTARLNVRYYGCRAATLERQNFWIELVLAATATGSAIAGFTFWKTDSGKVLWQAPMTISAIVAVAKPLLKLTDRVKKAQEVTDAWRNVEYDLKKLVFAIKMRRSYDSDLQSQFVSALDRMKEAAGKTGEYGVHKRLLRRCQSEVANELPAGDFYVPPSASVSVLDAPQAVANSSIINQGLKVEQ